MLDNFISIYEIFLIFLFFIRDEWLAYTTISFDHLRRPQVAWWPQEICDLQTISVYIDKF